MAKKKIDTEVDERTNSSAPKITPLLGVDFGREDLNAVVAKLNEVIEELNK